MLRPHRVLLRTNTSPEEVLYIDVPASLLSIFFSSYDPHYFQIFKYHWQFDIVSLVRSCWWGMYKDWHYHWPCLHREERLSSAQAIEGTTTTIQRQQGTLHTYRWVGQIKAKAVSKLAMATAAAALPCQHALKSWMFLAMPLTTVVAVAEEAVISDKA